MTRLARWPSFLLLLVLLAWLPSRVPGFGGASEADATFTIGALLRAVVDPLVVVLAVLAAFLAGGWRGVRDGGSFLLKGARERASTPEPVPDLHAASRSLAAAGRGLLWGAFLLNAIYVVSFYWPAGPGSAGLLADFARVEYVKYGALLSITLGALLLVPSAEAAAELSGRRVVRATRAARGADALATVGLLGCAFTVLLSVFVYRAPVIGSESSGRTFILPSADGIGSSFVIWSLFVVTVVATLAFFSTVHASAAPSESGASGPGRSVTLTHRFARTVLAAGVLVATLVELAGMHKIARTGGQGNPAELESLVGLMLVPFAAGILVGACALLLPRRRSMRVPGDTALEGR